MAALKFLGLFFIAIGITKLIVSFVIKRRDEDA